MKKLILCFSVLAMIASAQANDQRLLKCLKDLGNLQSESRRGGRPGEETRLRIELQRTQIELQRCQSESRRNDRGELEILRRELRQTREELASARFNNVALRDRNENLKDRLQVCEDRNPVPTGELFCTAACKGFDNKPDNSQMGKGLSYNELEAKLMARQDTMAKNNCFRGVVNIECTPQGYEGSRYCVAGCLDFNGNVDLSQSSGAYGSSTAEATYNVFNKLKNTYNCFRGMKVSSCQ